MPHLRGNDVHPHWPREKPRAPLGKRAEHHDVSHAVEVSVGPPASSGQAKCGSSVPPIEASIVDTPSNAKRTYVNGAAF